MTASTLRELFRQQRDEIAEEIRATRPDGSPRWTLAEIGHRRGISRERVRQIGKLYGIERRPRHVAA